MQTMQRVSTDLIFETSDLYLSAFLMTRGVRLWGINNHDPARVIFILTPRPHPEDLAAYAEGTATANVGAFGRALRQLKRALHGRADEQ